MCVKIHQESSKIKFALLKTDGRTDRRKNRWTGGRTNSHGQIDFPGDADSEFIVIIYGSSMSSKMRCNILTKSHIPSASVQKVKHRNGTPKEKLSKVKSQSHFVPKNK